MMMQGRLSQLPQEYSNSTHIKNEILNEVMGTNSHSLCRAYGLQHLKSQRFKCQNNQINIKKVCQDLIRDVREEFEDRFA